MLTKTKKSPKEFLRKLWHSVEEFRARHPVIYIAIVFLIGILCSLIIEKGLRVYYNRLLKTQLTFNANRLILVGTVTEVILMILAYGKKGIDFIYKYRYLFGAGLFVLCVAMRLNYSSSGMLDGSIQPNHTTQTDDILTGVNRAIRSDEYIVSTPMILSQGQNDFNLVNPDIMADDVVTSFYPKLPNKTLTSVLTNPHTIGFAFLPLENAYSFYQLLPWFVAFFAVFEMLMIITKRRKLMSLIGAFVVIFSPVMLWFDSIQNVMYVALLFDIFYLFIHHGKTWKAKLGFSVLFGWVAACFVMMIYPAWQVPYGYVLLALLISLLVDNRKVLKWRDLIYVLPVIGMIAVLVLPNVITSLDQYRLTTQTVYPGQRSENGGGGALSIFYYIASIFFPLVEVPNPCEASGFIGLFPIPILVGLYVIIKSWRKKERPDPVLIGLVVLSLCFSFMCLVGNEFIAKITLLFFSPTNRLRPVLELTCLLIIIRLLGVYQTAKPYKRPALLAMACAIITAILVYLGTIQINTYASGAYMHSAMICAAFIVYYILIYGLLDRRKQTGYVIGVLAALFSGYQFLTIHPLRVGLDVYTDKPVAEKIRELSAKNQEALWLTSGPLLSDYALANDARVINSVNYYPIADRWRLFDPNGENDYIYNRYAHIGIAVSDQDATSFELLAPDAFAITLNYKDVCLLEPTYFLSDKDYRAVPGWSKKLIYDEDGMYIYQLDCQSEDSTNKAEKK